MKRINLQEIKVWDNDMPLFSEFFDAENKVYYMNNWATPNHKPFEIGTDFIITPAQRKMHNDDVRSHLKNKLGENYQTVKF